MRKGLKVWGILWGHQRNGRQTATRWKGGVAGASAELGVYKPFNWGSSPPWPGECITKAYITLDPDGGGTFRVDRFDDQGNPTTIYNVVIGPYFPSVDEVANSVTVNVAPKTNP